MAENKQVQELPAASQIKASDSFVLEQDGKAMHLTGQILLDWLSSQVSTGNAVLYVYQNLTDAQKSQARTNIGAVGVGEGGSAANAVLYVWQTLTETQQMQARRNIRCGSVGEVSENCKALVSYSHAEGDRTTASGYQSHAEGYGTTASGVSSHAEGSETTAEGLRSHAEGYRTTASGGSQHVQGRYNVKDTEDIGDGYSKYAHIVGNGTADDARSNAHTLDWEGVPWYAGDRIMLGGTGMDDGNAVALQPVFVPQNLTDAQKAQARANIGAAAAGEGGGGDGNSVTYSPQTLTDEQKAQARANIDAMSQKAEALNSQIVFNHTDKLTIQLKDFYKLGRFCVCTLQFTVTSTITDEYAFTLCTLPVAANHRVWFNGETKFYISTEKNKVQVNNSSIAAGNYVLTASFICMPEVSA